jgi:tRNA-modifying protein YgfZ
MYSTDGYQALRTGAAVVRRGDRGLLAVTGADRLVWLQGLLTNDVLALTPGQSCYSAYLTPQGRMITDLRVLNLPDRTLLEVPGVLAEGLRAKFDGLLFAEDARVQDLSDSLRVIDLIGPGASMVDSRTRDRASEDARYIPGGRIDDDFYGVPGITYFVERANEDGFVAALLENGAIETSLETLDIVRVEAGRPLFLVDMDEHTIPLEANLADRAISFTKGCYVGQEVIVRVTQRGQGRVAKKLIGLEFDKDQSPHAGDLIGAERREVGKITSVAWSPARERPIALGYAHRDFVEPGTHLHVMTSTGAVLATVVALPFVPRRI